MSAVGFETMTTPLCATCKELFVSKRLTRYERKDASSGLDQVVLLDSATHDFDVAAEAGCRLCTLCLSVDALGQLHDLRWAISSNLNASSDDKATIRYSVSESMGELGGVLNIAFCGGPFDEEEKGAAVDVDVDLFNILLVPFGDLQLELSENTGSSSSLNLAAAWMRDCDATHDKCRLYQQQVKSNQIPTRLIDIGDDGADQARIREDARGNIQYATLSHRWGEDMPLRLLISNLPLMKERIPMDQLSQTFREAISVCRHLGIRYLWIDSLCIIQDSAEDWLRESGRMHSVYSNGVLNICANAATNSTGLFQDVNPQHLHTGPIQVDWGTVSGVLVGVLEGMFRDHVYHSLLNKRAWVLQERLLSLRNLHFASGQLFWECQQHTACEIMPDGIPGTIHLGSGYQKRLMLHTETPPGIVAPEGAAKHLDALRKWYEIVNTYSMAALTQKSDKLVAIAALARHCQRWLGIEGDYLAGLWNSHLAHRLLWYAFHNPQSAKAGAYRAPSWSWVSVDVSVWYDDSDVDYTDDGNLLVEIVDWNMTLLSDDPYGPVSDGHLIITGRLAKVVVCTDFLPRGFDRHEPENCTIVGPDCYINRVKVMLDCYVETEGVLQEDIMDHCLTGEDVYLDLFVMPVRQCLDPEKREKAFAKGGSWSWVGLVLKRVEGQQGTFQRYGIYTMTSERDMALFEQAFADFDLHADESGLDFVGDGKGGNRYTIKLV